MPNDNYVNRLLMGGYGAQAQYPQPSYGGGNNITALLLEQGRAQADAARANGERWSNAFQQAGQQIGGAFQQVAEEKKLKARDAKWMSVINDPEVMKDPRKAYAASQELFGPEGDKHFQSLVAMHQLAQPKRDQAADTKALVAFNKGYKDLDPATRAQGWGTVRPLIMGAFGTELPEQYDDAQYTKMWAPAIEGLEPKAKGKHSLQKTDKGLQDYDEETGTLGDVVAQPEAPAPKAETRSLDVQAAEALAKGDKETYSRLLKVKKEMGQADDRPRISITGPPVDINDPAVDVAARRYNATGVLPPRAAGGDFIKAVMRRGAQLNPNADIAESAAEYRADTGSQASLQRQADTVAAFEKTVTRNSAILKETLKKLPDTGTSLLNRPFRSLSNAMGSEDMARFNAARRSVANEYSRILQNSPGTLSDSARREASVLLDENATVSQILGALDVLNAEATNRNQSYSDQLDDIRHRRGSNGAPPKRQTATNPKTGQKMEFDGTNWVPVK